MRVEVADLLKRIGNKLKVADEEFLSFPEDGLSITGPVRVDLELLNIKNSILLTGRIEARVRLSCVRCLEDFEQTISAEVEEQYGHRAKPARSDDEIELKEDDFILPIAEDNSIDLAEAIRQNLIMALPIKPLCKTACRGLQGQGIAKEEGPKDPRLAKLKDIKLQLRRT